MTTTNYNEQDDSINKALDLPVIEDCELGQPFDEEDEDALSSASTNDMRSTSSHRRPSNSTNSGPSEQTVFARAIWVLRFAIFADAVNSQILGPNYALMVLEDGSPDSFPSTTPFGFGAAYYFMPMCGDIGMVLSSLFFGYLSDKIGRKKCILACMYLGAVGSVLKYLAQDSFLLFCAANFFTGLFGGSLAVGMAYASDIFPDQLQTDAEIGTLIAVSMVGRTGGGIVAILMQSIGLFAPLWVTAGVSLLAGVLCHVWMQDKDRSSSDDQEDTTGTKKEGDKDYTDRTCDLGESSKTNHNTAAAASSSGDTKPQEIDSRALWNVLAGELADNLGSIGLVPFCISPLMFNTFYADFVGQDLDPIMSATAYKWIYVLVAVIVVPGAAAAPFLFKRFGPALSAVMANLLTGLVTIGLLQIANAQATVATFAIFVTVLYLAFPMTVISQLSTGPMLDRIAPEHQRGRIQGYNMAMMNLAGAIGPFLLGNLSDATSIDICLYTTAGISVLAAVINYPLSKDPRLGPTKDDEEEEQETGVPPLPPQLPLTSAHLSFRASSTNLHQASFVMARQASTVALSTHFRTPSSRAFTTSSRALTTSSRALR